VISPKDVNDLLEQCNTDQLKAMLEASREFTLKIEAEISKRGC